MIKNLAIGGSNRGLLLLALLMGAVCAALVGVYLSGLESGGGSGETSATVPVVVAARDIPAQTLIAEDMLVVKDMPEDLALVGSFTQPADLVGLRTQIALVAGQQLQTTNASDATIAQEAFGPDAPLSLVIPAGKRAFAIYVSPVASVGGLARSGDYVDLMLSSATGEEGDASTAPTCLAMQDIQVLAVGQTPLRPAAEGDPTGIDAVAANPQASTYTLAVTDQQAMQLAAAQEGVSESSVGQQLWVVLRPFGDHTPTNGPACDLGI
jgi:Flp pilus assembly protein CpaB